MKLEMFASNSFEIWIMTFFLLTGVGFLLFAKKEGLIFIGVLMLTGVTVISYGNHVKYMGERFLMEQFHEGQALACGMWRGESARVDPSKGWYYEEEVGFVKGDVIINDPGVCSVIGKPFPEPSTVPYWFTFVSVTGMLIMLRAALRRHEEKSPQRDEEKDNDTRAE
ncbi:MAG: hypothetical protein PHV10_04360 [Sulfuricurvum sp.]|nr:hypothetical protein [Sulfuricurvum sp.]